ncbi:MAG: class A sortase [Kurthia sp.]|nr:class A sortase [Candidatus Kurthia equi]
MKRKLSLTIGLILLVLGIALIFNKQIMGFIVTNMTEQAISQFDEAQAKNSKDVNFEFDDVKDLSLQDVLKAQMNNNDVHSVGTISVPDVGLQLPILYGVSNTNLAIGAGTMKKDMKLGKGNYALAGHNMNNNTTLFSPLTKAEKGMKMYTTNYERVYTYTIKKIFIIEASQVDVIEDKENERLLTLVTCNYDGSKRLIIQGEYNRADDFDKAPKNAFTTNK